MRRRHLRVPAVGGEQYRRTRTKAIHVLSSVVFYNNQKESHKDPRGCTIVLKIYSNIDSEKDSVNFTANLSETKN